MANVITRAVGVEQDVTIDQISGELVRGDIFLLCTDGLNKELSDIQIAQCMQAKSVTDAGLALCILLWSEAVRIISPALWSI